MAVFQIKAPSSRQGASQTLATGAASATLTNAFGTETFQVRLACTAACHYRITETANPAAATATDSLLPANWVEYVTVTPGQKLTAIQDAAAGVLSVTEMS